MIVVADAAPLIFLAKLDQLKLIPQLFGKNILIPSLVANEVLRPPLPPGEELRLQRFLDSTTVIPVKKSRKKSLSLSPADLAVYQLALDQKANVVLSDDKLLRSLLTAEGLSPMGTLGILIHATKNKLLTKPAARSCIDDLVGQHNLRIGIELYEYILESLNAV